MDDIELLRKKIDELDNKILKYLEARVKIAESIGKLKLQKDIGVSDPGREQRVLENICSNTKIDKKFTRELFKLIINYCKNLQACNRRSDMKVKLEEPIETPDNLTELTGNSISVLGPHGTFTDIAARTIFEKPEFKYMDTIEDVFAAAEKGGLCVVPIENSLEGSVSVTMDCLVNYDVKISGEIYLDINLCLIGKMCKDDLKPENIKTILSHPQALAQSRQYLKENFPGATLQSTSSTAAAMKELKNMENALAIGSKNNAKIYDLEIIAENVNDDVSRTRFIVISSLIPKDGGKGNKSSIIFAVKDKPGALFDVLCEFSKREINLTKIESRPSRRKLGEYFFFVDFEGDMCCDGAKAAIEGIKDKITFLKGLGSY